MQWAASPEPALPAVPGHPRFLAGGLSVPQELFDGHAAPAQLGDQGEYVIVPQVDPLHR